jgi:transcriptional regulator with XRE-family HTH domain
MKEYSISYKKAVALLVNERKKRGIKQAVIRQKLNYGLNTILKFEKNDGYVNLELLEDYAIVLGCKITLSLLSSDSL